MTKPPRFSVAQLHRRAKEAEAQPPLIIATTVRWPDDLHRWMTMKARDDRTSIQQMILTWARDARKERS